MNIVVAGAGAWGTALAIHLSQRHRVTLWTRNTDHLAELANQRVNQRYLPEQRLPDSIQLAFALEDSLTRAELVVMVVPVAGLRETLQRFAAINSALPLILGCKGFEVGSAKLSSHVVEDVYPAGVACGILSGPSFAQEVAAGLPTALTLASQDTVFAQTVADAIRTARLRVYSSDDVIGAQVGGALKNVIAIAAGISDGIGYGHNARAALITRGLAEMTRLGMALGGRRETFMGLTGLGDLILTCTGNLSRNRRVGMMLATGHQLTDIMREIGHVTEGVHTVREARKLGRQLQIEMPFTQAIYQILYEQVPVEHAIEDILNRAPGAEID